VIVLGIGTTVYDISLDMLETLTVAEIHETPRGTFYFAVNSYSESTFPESEIEKTIFDNKAVAMKALTDAGHRPREIVVHESEDAVYG